MSFTKQITQPNGVTTNFHKIVKIELKDNSPTLNVQIASWVSKEVHDSEIPASWNTYLTVAANTLYLDTQTAILNTADFADALVLADLDDLGTAKQRKWVNIKGIREQLEFGGFEFNSNVYDSDLVSQSRIQGAVILAMQNSQFNTTWTLQNNTTVQLSATDLIGLGQALAQHIGTLHAHSQELRAEIDRATTTAEVEAIQW